MSFARVNGAVLHWTASDPADERTVVFCNSLGTDFRIWDSCVAALPDRLAELIQQHLMEAGHA